MKKILEIGSGDGFFTYTLSKSKNNLVYGIDLSRENIKTSKKRYPKVNYQVMNSEKLSFSSKYFDEVYAMDVLEHVDHLNKVINEIKRVLKKNGIFIINIPYFKSEKWLLKMRPTYLKEIHHVRIFKENELENTLHELGFKLLDKKKTGFLQHIELFFLFKRKIKSKNQKSIGSWRDTFLTKVLHLIILFFDPIILKTPLKFIPIWIITLPIGFMINYVGNKYFPKSQYYIFQKDE